MDALNAMYVEENATKTIAQSVIDKLLTKNNNNIGTALIRVNEDGTVTILTSDFYTIGTVDENGTLTWGEVEIVPSDIELSRSTLLIESGETETLTVIFKKIPQNTEVVWTSSDETNKITVNDGIVTVDLNAPNGMKATITATVTYNDTEYAKTCEVTVKRIVPIGEYVEYGVSYTDMYVSDLNKDTEQIEQFTAENGWRIINAETKYEDGSWGDVELISTGCPVLLNYNLTRVSNSDGTYSTIREGDENTPAIVPVWWATKEQLRKAPTSNYYLHYDTFVYGNKGYTGCFAAMGLEKNFELIPFTQTEAGYNRGQYTAINNGTEATGEINGSVFKTSDAESVSTLTPQLLSNALETKGVARSEYKDSLLEGLFYLKGLTQFNYDSVKPYYWEAYSKAYPLRDRGQLNFFNEAGRVTATQNQTYGLRPVIKLKSNKRIVKNDSTGRWQIQ